MRWTLSGAALAALVLTQPVSAQPGPRPAPGGAGDDVRRLEAQLDKLRAEMKEVESKLQRARGTGPREGDRKEPGRPATPAPREADRRPAPRPEADRKEPPKPEAGRREAPTFSRGPGGFGPPAFGRGPTPPSGPSWNRPGPGPDRMAEIEKRLDQLTKAVEELRRGPRGR